MSMAALQEGGVQLLPLPARSPDLSPVVEHFGDKLGRKIYDEMTYRL